MLLCLFKGLETAEIRPGTLTVCGVGGLLDWRFLDLHFHTQTCRPLPAPRISSLPDNLGDPDHGRRDFEINSQVQDQAVTEELVLSHGGEPEGDDENRRGSDLHRCGTSQQDFQHLIVRVEEVGACRGVELRNVLV